MAGRKSPNLHSFDTQRRLSKNNLAQVTEQSKGNNSPEQPLE